MSEIKLQVTIKDPTLCPRYQAVVMQLPEKLRQKYLKPMVVDISKSGMRAIDPVVDVTNYLMLLTGQPLHAFDYDKLVAVGGQETAHIIVRAAKNGEKMTLLDGKEIEMSEGDIVITSNDVPVALAGAMGGANTVIDENTRHIVIESATFNLYNLRGTQFRHGIFSEAITRFTKGQPAELTAPVLSEAVAKMGGKVLDTADAYPKPVQNKPIKLSADRVNGLLGTDYSYAEIEQTLRNVGFEVTCDCGKSDKCDCEAVNVTAPWWRTDIHIAEDVIEELGRLRGYDNISLDLPKRSFTAPEPDSFGAFKSEIRRILSSLGANETLTYSFISEKLLKNVGQDPKNAYKITNSLSPELQYVRQSIVPSLLEKVRPNTKDKFDNFALFEMNQVYRKNDGLTNEQVPFLRDDLGFVVTGDYYLAKKYVAELLNRLGVEAQFTALDGGVCSKPLEPKRAAQILSMDGQTRYGSVGEFKANVRRSLKLPETLAGFELNIDRVFEDANRAIKIKRNSDYPNVERDMTFQVISNTEYVKLENLICQELEEQDLKFELLPVSIYQGDDKTTKNISFRLTFASYQKTLGADEIDRTIGDIAGRARAELKAEVI